MEFRRIAVCCDTSLRPDTTGGYCLRALQQMAEVEHLAPERLTDPTPDYDLYLCVDDGLDYPFPSHSLGTGSGPRGLLAMKRRR